VSLFVGYGLLIVFGGSYAASTYTSPAIKWHIDAPLSDSPEESCKKKIVDASHTWLQFHHLELNPIYSGSSSYPMGGYDCYVLDNSDSPPTVKFYRTTASGYVCTDPTHNLVSPFYLCEISAGGVDLAKQQCDREPDCVNQSPVRDLPNPINPATGNKYLVEVDYIGAGLFPLHFRRYYNSRPPDLGSLPGSIGAFGRHWRGSFDRYVYMDAASQQSATVFRPSGNSYTYRLTGSNVWVSDAGVTAVLERLFSGSTPTGWKYTDPRDDSVEIYDTSGKLVSIANRSGISLTLTYFTSGANSGLLEKVGDTYGRELVFGYDSQKRLTSMVNPAGSSAGAFTYGYDSNGNLQSVTDPDSRVRTYRYEDSSFPKFVTGITDENSVAHTSYEYDSQGRAKASERAGQAERVTVSYPSSTSAEVVSYVSASLSATRTYQYTTINGINRPISITGAVCPSCGPAALSYESTTGFLTSRTDWNNNKTCYVRDSRGLETSRVEGLGSSANCASLPSLSGVQRKISTDWHSTFRLVKKLAEPKRLTTFVFNGEGVGTNCGPEGASTPAGLICSKTVQATTDTNGSAGLTPTVSGTARTWTYKYNAEGQVTEENGPRIPGGDIPSGHDDKTTYAYYANTTNICPTSALPGSHANGCRGQLQKITNALGHETTIDEYNAHGQPLKTTDPNGLVTVLEYDTRQRLTKRIVGVGMSGALTTLYEYWPTGLLKKMTHPDGSFLLYTYDAAHRLTQIEDSLGNKVVYTLDAMGNRVLEETKNSGGSVVRALSREYNSLNHLIKQTGGATSTQVTHYEHDPQGNLIRVTLPLAPSGTDSDRFRSHDYAYDALNRLISNTEPRKDNFTSTPRAVVSYEYDLLDQLVKVKDPRSTTAKPIDTVYTIDGLGNVSVVASPDTGTTTNQTIDAAGNVVQRVDGKGQSATFQYDALNRVTQVTYPGPVVHTFTYDDVTGGNAGKGRLTGVSDPTGSTSYRYDVHGRLIAEVRTIAGIAYTTSYGYGTNGLLTSMMYPSGRQLTFTRDGLGRTQKIETVKAGSQLLLVEGVNYFPFGPETTYWLGGTASGKQVTRTFDGDGRMTGYTLPGSPAASLGLDAASRITSVSDPFGSRTFTYDNIDRVIGMQGATTQSFGYDLSGNRTAQVMGGSSTLDYTSNNNNSNRLQQITGAVSKSYVYDANGSMCSTNGTACGPTAPFVYDTRGRLATANTSIGTFNYGVNALGQRVRKAGGSGGNAMDTIYHYDASGRLIVETTPSGTVMQEYFYLHDIPIGVLRAGP